MKKQSLIELLDATPKYQIYCDMDGVLTDFEKRFYEMVQKEGPKYYSKQELEGIQRPKHFEKKLGEKEFWKFIDEYIGLKFWTGMDWMPQGKELWNFISPYKPKILSSPSQHNSSRLGKRLWVKEHIDNQPEVIFRFGDSKADFSNKNSILIDDKPSNLAAWKAKGGIAIECKDGNTEAVIGKLKELGYQNS
jgi:hypothetical protein